MNTQPFDDGTRTVEKRRGEENHLDSLNVFNVTVTRIMEFKKYASSQKS